MNRFRLCAPLLLTVSLAACAPAMTGSQVSLPILASSALSPAQALPGQTTYVQYTYPGGALDIPDARFDDLKIDFNVKDYSGNVKSPEVAAGWLNLKVSGLPAGWNITLAQAYLVKTIVKTNTDGTEVRFHDDVRVIYKITAPSDAATATAQLQFLDGSKALGSVPLMLTVGSSVGSRASQ